MGGAKGKGNRKRKVSSRDADIAVAVMADELTAQQRGGSVNQRKDDDLFVIDTQPDNAAGHIPGNPSKRPRRTKEKKITRAAAILAAGTQALPLGPGTAYGIRKKAPPQLSRLEKKAAATAGAPKPEARDLDARITPEDVWVPQHKEDKWVEDVVIATRPSNLGASNRPRIAAVEVDPAGCSYNPEYEQHQDALALAVANEVDQHIARALEPVAPPLVIPAEDVQLAEMGVGLESESEEDDEDEEGGEGAAEPTAKAPGRGKKTKKDRAKEGRRRAQEDAVAEKKALKALRRDLVAVKDLKAGIAEEEAETQLKLARLKADRDQKELVEPPKLGKNRYKAGRVHVLASDDVTGSLRTLKTVPAVARDRFNSLQKRGHVQVTVQSHYMKPTKNKKQFEKGGKMENAKGRQQEVEELQKHNRAREKALKPKKK